MPAEKPRAVHLPSLHLHHRQLLLYGLVQAAVALLATGLDWLPLQRVSLALPGQAELMTHSPVFLVLDALLVGVAITYALAAAIRAALWLRLVITAVAAGLLLYLGWGVGAAIPVLLPVLFAAAYVLWRGAGAHPHHPAWLDLSLLGGAVLLAWVHVLSFGLRPPESGVLGTLHLGLAQVVTIAAFLPVPLLLLAGLDLAELGESLSQRLSRAASRLGERPLLAGLLLLSVAKLAFHAFSGGLHPDAGWLATLLFILALGWLLLRTPPHLLAAELRFTHWLGLSGLALLAPAVAGIVLAFSGSAALTSRIGPLTLALLGPVWLLAAAVVALRPQARPLALFIAFTGLWATLSIGLQPLSRMLGLDWPGIAARDLDLAAALGFGLWSLWLLARRRTSPLVPLALAVSLFLDCGYVLQELMDHHVAAAELYTVAQGALYLAVLHLSARPGRAWLRYLPWLLVAGFFGLSRLHGPWAQPVAHLVAAAVVAAAMVWDLVMCEHRMGGPHAGGPLARPGRLFLYLAYATWVVTQILFANTGEGTEALALEPVIALGFVLFGLPRVLHLFLAEGRHLLHSAGHS